MNFFTEKDATISILENNLYGLDIDDRAYQLAYFALMMKARGYSRRILNKNINPLICSIQESNTISNEFIEYLSSKCPDIKMDLLGLTALFKDAKEYGCILDVKKFNYKKILEELDKLSNDLSDLYGLKFKSEIGLFKTIIKQAQLLNQKYDVVVTNPPYMGNSGMNEKLKECIKSNYPLTKTDLFAVFIEKGLNMIKDYGFNCMVTMQSWMFLSSFEKFRKKLIETTTITNLLHMDNMVMRIAFGTSATVFRKFNLMNYNSSFYHVKLSDINEDIVYPEFFNDKNKLSMKQSNFNRIPGQPIAYWISEKFVETFDKGICIEELGQVRQGLIPGNSKYFLKYWFEVDYNKIGFNHKTSEDINKFSKKWFPYNKGGSYRKWFGNIIHVINMENDGYEIKHSEKNNNYRLRDPILYFKPAITWSKISSGKFSARVMPEGHLFDIAGCCIFFLGKNFNYILGFCNSCVADYILEATSPTLNYEVEHIKKLPILFGEGNLNKINKLVSENIKICKNDWDYNEISFDFRMHPFLFYNLNDLNLIFNKWMDTCKKNFDNLKLNEKNLNYIFNKIYQLELNEDVPEKYITVYTPNIVKDVKSFISYAIGCMFGRYSLNDEGVIYAGGNFEISKYSKFLPDNDNIIPVLDTEYFEDDIVGRFVEFIKTIFGEETIEKNLEFIAKALSSSKKPSREIIREYLLKNFFADHKKTYQKCPIYWQFNSGKENAFNCLVYIHRYEPSLVARIRTDYLHKTQKAIEQNINRCDNIINTSNSSTEKNKVNKEKNKLIKQLEETKEYDEALAYIANQNISIDLDDGIKVNYEKFQNIEVIKEGKKSKINLLKKI